ncbi:MAG: type IV secretion system DNA-binding domain-containing protein [Candidatus Roizmanbacteria bacterium]|nr:type IV secretion system DNA-binding domain-containing protein [Candidatus Roizmanbacteria bacterium]
MEAALPIIAQIQFFALLLVGVLGVGLLTYIFFRLAIIMVRFGKREERALDTVVLRVKVPRENEVKIDAAEQFFNALYSIKKSHEGLMAWFDEMVELEEVIGLEIVGTHGDISFYLHVPKKLTDLVEKQIYAMYSSADIIEVEEPNIFTENGHVAYAALVQKEVGYFPIKTFRDMPTDSISGITSALSKMSEGEGALVQVLIRPAHGHWKKEGKAFTAETRKKETNPEKATYKYDQKTLEKIDDKSSRVGFESVVRIVVNSTSGDSAKMHLANLKAAFTQFNSDLNAFRSAKILFKPGFMYSLIYRYFPMFEWGRWKCVSLLTPDELASLFHFPNKTIEAPNINWLKAKKAPAPTHMPSEGIFIGFSKYRGVRIPVFIGPKDRQRHVYIIGKTGVGKTQLLVSMISQDINKGKGLCFIDPHGDAAESILELIPPERAEDVIYFDPSDSERPMGLNIMEAHTEEQKHFMASAIINLMYKLYDPQRTGIVGPRFEHAVRNAMLTVMCEEGNTFIEVNRILTDPKFVNQLLPKVKDPIIRRYWTDQIAQTSDFHKSEVLDYIASKFGRFVTNKMIRNIIGQSKSSFDFRKVMDEGKILIINLSKGKLGEENSQFLGLVLIPKLLSAAMSRADMPEKDRRDFYLYVDEFQNFATGDFAIILSEARKYALNLTVANQFIGQMEEEVKNAIFGNVGTIVGFRVGVTDGGYLQHEFQPVFNETDLINVERFHAYMKTNIDNEPVPPFSVDMSKDMKKEEARRNPQVAEAIKQLSRLKYGKPQEVVDYEIAQRARL